MKYITMDKANNYRNIITKIIRICKAKFPSYIGYEDLQQEAMLALMKALNDYDPAKGATDTTLVYKYVKTHLDNYASSLDLEEPTELTLKDHPLCADPAEATAALLDMEEACTKLEWQVLECMVLGMSKGEIAERFALNKVRIESIVHRLYMILKDLT